MYAVLPKGAKPSKAVSKDQSRPQIISAELVCTSEEEQTYELQATDSYKLARVPLFIEERDSTEGEHALEPGMIEIEALKAIEKAGAFRANGTVVPVKPESGIASGPAYPRPEREGRFPNVEQLTPDVEGGERIVLRFNAEFLWQLAQALGVSGPSKIVELEVISLSENGDVRETLRPLVVRNPAEPTSEPIGLLMPIRRH